MISIKNILLTFKNNGLWVFMFLMSMATTMAQEFRYPVVAKISQKAPYPIYLSDYANPAQQVFSIQLEVRDNLLPTRRVKLKLFIESSSTSIQSTPVIRNEEIILLSSGQTYNLPSNLVANYFQNYNLNISPSQYAQSLPEGIYRFGIQVIDASTGKGLSGVQYAAPVWLTVNEPPVWVSPINNTVIHPLSPQNINFQWAARHKNISDVEYEFSLTELEVPINFRGNIQNLFLSQPSIYSTKTRLTNLNYNFGLPPLIPGKIYAYRVRAIAKIGLKEIGLFRNSGYSEIQWFRYTQPLSPPHNLAVKRLDPDKLELTWQGDESHYGYEIKAREKGQSWKTFQQEPKPISANNSLTLMSSPEGTYEFQVGSIGDFYQEKVFTDIVRHKDSLSSPYNLDPSWLDSTTAAISWFGSNAHKSFKVLYHNSHEEEWRSFSLNDFEDYEADPDYYSFSCIIPYLSSDSGYVLKVVAADIDGIEVHSKEAYLAPKKIEDQLIKLKEKTILGRVNWAFIKEEYALGKLSGTAQENWTNQTSPKSTFIHQKKNTSSVSHPIENAIIEVFTDNDLTVLLKSITADKFGRFQVSFPVEALRGGNITDSVYLKLDHPTFGIFTKAISTKSFDDELDIGEWVIPAKTYRLKLLMTDAGKEQSSSPSEHVISIYRRISALESAPHLAYENFRDATIISEKINNEAYYKVAEGTPGKSISGMFYDEVSKKHELLLKISGPSPYEDKLTKIAFVPKNGVYEEVRYLTQLRSEPYIYGTVTYEESDVLKTFNLELIENGNFVRKMSTNTNGYFRFDLNENALDPKYNYSLKVFDGSDFLKEVQVPLNPFNIGTEKNIIIENQTMVVGLAQLLDDNNKAIAEASILHNGKWRKTDSNGWFTFVAPDNSSQKLLIERKGFPSSYQNFTVKAVTKGGSKEVSNLIENSLLSLLSKSENTPKPNNSQTTLLLHDVVNYFNTDSKPNESYGGSTLITIRDNSKPKDFELFFTVIDKDTREKLSGITITENNLDLLGKTNSQGTLTFNSNIGRGHQSYTLDAPKTLMRNGYNYASKEVSFQYPDLNSSQTKGQIIVELESGSWIRGVVYEKGSGIELANANVNIEFPGIDIKVKTDVNGRYEYRFKNTPEENFLTLTGSKEGYINATVYMAVAQSYGTSYERDIFIKKSNIENLTEKDEERTVTLNLDIHGFKVTKVNSVNNRKDFSLFEMYEKITSSSIDYAWTLSGEIIDRNQNKYSFEEATFIFSRKEIGTNQFQIETKKMISRGIKLKTSKENRFLKGELPMAEDAILYLDSKDLNNDTNTDKGVIYYKELKLNTSLLTDELTYVYNNYEKDHFSSWSLFYQNHFSGIKYTDPELRAHFKFPIAMSYRTTDPIKEIVFYASSTLDDGNKAVDELYEYYGHDSWSKQKLDAVRNSKIPMRYADGSGGIISKKLTPFYFNNTIFESLLLGEKGAQVNNVVVMPLMSIDNIKIDLMNIPFIRLSENELKEVLIDYSRSPRKLSMGKETVNAQIEEVHIQKDGVDVVYFTNDGGNYIEPSTPDMEIVFYNANGIFYENYKTQKEIVQTAAVLNEVQMFGIPEPAMGPGYRIKVTATQNGTSERTGFHINKLLENSPKYASLFQPSALKSYEEAAVASLKLEGKADFTLDPHTFTTSWKFDDTKKEWKTKLDSWKALNFWGDILPPTQFELKTSDNTKETLSAIKGNKKEASSLQNGELKVVHNVSIPFLSSFEMQCEAQWNPDSSKFDRLTTSAKGSLNIPKVLELSGSANLLMNSKGEVSGHFGQGSITVPALEVGVQGAGGGACIERGSTCDQLWGFQFALSGDAGIGPKALKMYGLKLGFLYDGAGDAIFLQLATSLGIGKEVKIPSELVQFTTDPKADSTAKAEAKLKADEKVADLNNTKSETERVNEANTANSEFQTAKADYDAKKEDKEAKEDAYKKSKLKYLMAKITGDSTSKAKAKQSRDSLKIAYNASKNTYETVKTDYKQKEADKKEADKSLKEIQVAKENAAKAATSSDDANTRLENRVAIDERFKKEYKTSRRVDSTNTQRIRGVKKVVLEEIFIATTGRSPFEPKDHPVTLSDAEVTLTFSSRGGWTITGAGTLGLNSMPLLTAGFLVSRGNDVKTQTNADFRVFVAMPSFERPSVGPLTDLKISAQFDIGSYKDKFNLMLMGAASADIQAIPSVYFKTNLRLAVGINAITDSKTLDDGTVAGGETLSETARKIVGFMGSSFNDIAEEAIGQRKKFFGAIGFEYLASDSTFSGFYFGGNFAALFGISRDFDFKYLAGSGRIGLGAEVGASILKSFENESYDFRFKVAPIIDIGFKLRQPIEFVLIDEKIDWLSSLCLSVGYNAVEKKHHFRVLYNIMALDKVLGEQVTPGEILCNQFGLVFVRPCVYIYLLYDSDKVGKNGFFIDVKKTENVGDAICPINW